MHDLDATMRPACKRRSVAYLLIPATAFVLGIAGAVIVAKSSSDPYRGVYRQEVVPVVAEMSGRVLKFERTHGAEVRPGDPLVSIENGTNATTLKSLEADRERLRRELADATAKATLERTLRLDGVEKERLETQLRYAELLRTRLDVQLRRKALETGEDVNPSVASASTGDVTLASIQTRSSFRQLELADVANHEEVLNTQITLCEDRLAELDRLKAALPASIESSLRIDAMRAELATVSARCDELQNAAESFTIGSPAYGRVGVFRKRPGDFVSAGETMVEVFDAERPYVLVSLPVSGPCELAIGQHVRVAFQGLATRKPLEGVVADVVSDAERTADVAAGPGAATACVRITPVGRLWPTPPAGATAYVTALD
jgi:multidrug resistance efflux pump